MRVEKELVQWNTNGPTVLVDCGEFVRRTLRDAENVTPEDALGAWLLWNLYGRAPTRAEAQLTATLGRFLDASFAAWWVQNENA